MTTASQKPLKIFCSYSHKDEKYLNDLRASLRVLERRGLIDWWHDRQIEPGWEWEEAIDKHLRTADIILLLISPDFMASDFVYEQEMQRAIDKHKRGVARAIPIIVRPTDWEWPPLDKLQALPKDAKPITTWPNRDEAWLDVVKGIRRAIEELLVERREQTAEERYRLAVEEVWADNDLSDVEAEQLGALASELSLSADTFAKIEREVMGDTKEAILEHQEQAARETTVDEPSATNAARRRAQELGVDLSTIQGTGSGGLITIRDVTDTLYRRPPSVSRSATQEHQERAAREEERRKQLDELYDRAHQLYRNRAWQEVVDTFAQIHSEDPMYPDPKGLLMSAREALDTQRGAAAYSTGQRHMDAEEWQQAIESFEEVQQFKPDYRETETLLSRARRRISDDYSKEQASATPPVTAKPPTHHLQAFLCHSSEDKPSVRQLYERLQAEGMKPWLDAKDLLPGQDWDLEIRRAVRDSHVVIVCISNRSVNKAGYLQKEIKFVLDRADEQPEGTIFVIPLKLEECEIPERLRRWQWVNYFEDDGYELLMRSLRYRAKQLGFEPKKD
jgi:hypothetical protein